MADSDRQETEPVPFSPNFHARRIDAQRVEIIFCDDKTETIHSRGVILGIGLMSLVDKLMQVAINYMAELAQEDQRNTQNLDISAHTAVSIRIVKTSLVDCILVIKTAGYKELRISVPMALFAELSKNLATPSK
jgi:hypothetical protein